MPNKEEQPAWKEQAKVAATKQANDARRAIDKAAKDKLRGNIATNARARMALQTAKEILKIPLDEEEVVRKGVIERAKDVGQLLRTKSEYKKALLAKVKGAVGYMEKMRSLGWMTNVSLAAMTSHKNVKAAEFIKLMEQEDWQNTVIFCMEDVPPKEEGQSTDSSKLKANAYKKLIEGISTVGKESELANTCISLMTPKMRKEFLEFYKNEVEEEDYKETLLDLNKHGVLNVIELENNGYEFKNDMERKQCATFYETQNDISGEAKNLLRESFGAVNKAGEMINFKNFFVLVAELGAGATILTNVIANGMRNGKIVPRGLLRLFGNEYVLGATGVIASIEMLRGKTLQEVGEDQETIKKAQLVGELNAFGIREELMTFFGKRSEKNNEQYEGAILLSRAFEWHIGKEGIKSEDIKEHNPDQNALGRALDDLSSNDPSIDKSMVAELKNILNGMTYEEISIIFQMFSTFNIRGKEVQTGLEQALAAANLAMPSSKSTK